MQTIHSAGTGAMEKTFHIAQRLLSTYDEMPRGERRLADLLLEDVGVLGYLTASDLADQAGVSKATAARLFRRLGYHGYRDAQREVRENKSTKAAAPEVPALSGGFLSPGEYLDAEVKHLVRTFETLPEEGWRRVGFGHPAFLRPEPEPDPEPDADASPDAGSRIPATLGSRLADPFRGRTAQDPVLPPVPRAARRDVFFFAQALSPATRRGRIFVLRALAAIARANPDRDVWIKLRHLPGENDRHKHREVHDYPSLMARLPAVPPNLRLTACTMDEALESAAIGLTCTSTAAVDLVRAGVPALVYLDYPGRHLDPLVEPMASLFAGSDLIAPLERLLALDTRPPAPGWVDGLFCPRDLATRVLADVAAFHDRPLRITDGARPG